MNQKKEKSYNEKLDKLIATKKEEASALKKIIKSTKPSLKKPK